MANSSTITIGTRTRTTFTITNVKLRLNEDVRFMFRLAGLLGRLRRVYERKKEAAPMGPVRLAGLRRAWGLTRTELAEILGVHEGDVYWWEEGAAAPPREISAVLRTLDCPANRALFGVRHPARRS